MGKRSLFALALNKKLMKLLLWKPQLSHFLIAFSLLLLTIKVNKVSHHRDFVSWLQVGVAPLEAAGEPDQTPEKDEAPVPQGEKKKGDTASNQKNEDSSEAFEFDPLDMDENQMKVLKALVEKRKQMEQEQASLEQRKKLLDLSQQKITTSLSELEKLKNSLEQKTHQMSQEEQETVQRITKIYENMKPETAAQIFDKFDLESLVQMAKHMNQKKFSAILSFMDPAKAQFLTVHMLPKPLASSTQGTRGALAS